MSSQIPSIGANIPALYDCNKDDSSWRDLRIDGKLFISSYLWKVCLFHLTWVFLCLFFICNIKLNISVESFMSWQCLIATYEIDQWLIFWMSHCKHEIDQWHIFRMSHWNRWNWPMTCLQNVSLQQWYYHQFPTKI